MIAHTLEPELNQSTPRRVRLRAPIAIWVFRIVSLPLAILASAFVAASCQTTWELLSHLMFGRTVEGQVVVKFIVPGDKRDAHFVDYTYSVDEQNYTGRARVSNERYESTSIGDSIRLQTLSWTPESSRIAIGSGFEFLAVLISWGITAVPCVIFGGFFWQLYYKPWRQRKLVRFGRVTAAVVTSIESGDGKPGTWRQIHYEYAPTAKGDPVQCKGSIIAWGTDAEATNVGDSLTVMLDQQHPHRSVAYRFADYAVVGPQGAH
jgi:hypothetical protein